MAKIIVVDDTGKVHKEIRTSLNVRDRKDFLSPGVIKQIEDGLWVASLEDQVGFVSAIRENFKNDHS